jgi:hypothetical protein
LGIGKSNHHCLQDASSSSFGLPLYRACILARSSPTNTSPRNFPTAGNNVVLHTSRLKVSSCPGTVVLAAGYAIAILAHKSIVTSESILDTAAIVVQRGISTSSIIAVVDLRYSNVAGFRCIAYGIDVRSGHGILACIACLFFKCHTNKLSRKADIVSPPDITTFTTLLVSSHTTCSAHNGSQTTTREIRCAEEPWPEHLIQHVLEDMRERKASIASVLTMGQERMNMKINFYQWLAIKRWEGMEEKQKSGWKLWGKNIMKKDSKEEIRKVFKMLKDVVMCF